MGHLGKSYFELTDAERDERQVCLARSYRKPMKPKGVA